MAEVEKKVSGVHELSLKGRSVLQLAHISLGSAVQCVRSRLTIELCRTAIVGQGSTRRRNIPGIDWKEGGRYRFPVCE